MAQYKDVIVNAGAGGFGGPLVLKPDDKKNKVVNITGGVISPVSQKIAELTGCELVDGFKTSVPDDEILCVSRFFWFFCRSLCNFWSISSIFSGSIRDTIFFYCGYINIFCDVFSHRAACTSWI